MLGYVIIASLCNIVAKNKFSSRLYVERDMVVQNANIRTVLISFIQIGTTFLIGSKGACCFMHKMAAPSGLICFVNL